MGNSDKNPLDKSNWNPGPWMTEPDAKAWRDEKTRLDCKIRRASLGHLCGYVAVGKTHPLFEKDYSSEKLNSVSIHGGLTFANRHSDEDKDSWYFGFDCAHCDDYSPGLHVLSGDENYRDIDYVINETKSLAQQLVNLS